MSSTGEPMPGLEKQRWLEKVSQDGYGALMCAAAELKGDRGIVLGITNVVQIAEVEYANGIPVSVLAKQGFDHVHKNFTYKQMVERIFELYKKHKS